MQAFARRAYRRRLEAKVSRGQARKDLPLSTYTEAYWKIDLHNLLHFLSLRLDESAQVEIRSYATVIGHDVVAKWCPLAWEAFLDYRIQAHSFSRLEMAILHQLTRGQTDAARKLAEDFGWLHAGPAGLKHNREREEFQKKLLDLGLEVPWE